MIGDAVNIASRHAGLAGPGEIVASAATSALVDIADGHAEDAVLKGVSGTIVVQRIQAGPPYISGDRRLVSA